MAKKTKKESDIESSAAKPAPSEKISEGYRGATVAEVGAKEREVEPAPKAEESAAPVAEKPAEKAEPVPEKPEKPKKEKKAGKSITLFMRVPLQEKILFARHMSIGIKSGMTLIASLELIREQTRSKSLKRIIDQVIDDVNAGVFLSKSLERYQNIFGELFVNIIRIGESSGTLSENLIYLTDELQKKHALITKVRGAMIYPAVVLCATIGIAVGLIVFIFPKILPVFQSVKVKLPFTTRTLIALSKLLTENGITAIITLIAFIILIIVLVRIKAVKHVIHHALLSMPITKAIMVKVNLANFSRTLGLLLKSGVHITDAVAITASTTANLAYRHEIAASAQIIQKGEFLSAFLSRNKKLFPPIAVNMIRVGENTGNLVENLNYLSEYYENQVDDFVKNLSSVLEPVLMLVMGVIVGFIALSIITPIYSLTQGLTER